MAPIDDSSTEGAKKTMGRKKHQTSFEEAVTYYRIRKANPEKKRKSFAITAHINKDGKVKSSTIKSQELDIINMHYQQGLFDFNTALQKCKVVLGSLYRERDDEIPEPDFEDVNLKTLHQYWSNVYSTRDIVDSKGFWHDLKSSIEALGTQSILAASKEELEKALNERWGHKPTKQRRCVSRLNPILEYLNRGFKLRKMRKVKEPLQYLKISEFQRVVDHLRKEDFQTLCWIALTTGLRKAEIFALKPSDRRDIQLHVSSQLYPDLTLRETKTRQERRAYIIDEGQKYLDRWFSFSEVRRNKLRNIKHSDILKRACRKVFDNPEKHCKFHDLRHAYAVILLQQGVPIAHVAHSLGNSVTVCERYYTGFVLTDVGVDLIHSIMTQNKK